MVTHFPLLGVARRLHYFGRMPGILNFINSKYRASVHYSISPPKAAKYHSYKNTLWRLMLPKRVLKYRKV
jgi:hypothetical protein